MKSTLKFSILFLLLVIQVSCKREKVDVIGPSYISAPSGFAVTSFTSSTSSVDFTATTVFFDAIFPQSVSWVLTIKGQESGAIEKYTGTGSSFSNLEWKGTHDGLYFFRSGETVNAVLSFYGNSYTNTVSINIVNGRNYTLYGMFPSEGHFENRLLVEPITVPPYYSNYFASFNYPTPIPNVKQGVDSMAVDYNGKFVPSVQGRKYYYIKGLGDQSNFVSGIQSTNGGSLTGTVPADPDNVYVNFYLYGTGDDNAGVEVEFQEDDIGSAPGYFGGYDDAMVAKVTLNHHGWKLFSFQYSKLSPSLNADFGGSGNKIHEPDRIRSIVVVLIKKSDPDSPVEMYLDFPIITYGGPFDPSK